MQVIRNSAQDAQHGANMQRQLLIAFGGGIASTFLLVTPLAGTFAPLPLLLAGLMTGARAVVIGGAVAFALIAMLDGLATATFYAGTNAVPAWIIVYHALSQRFVSGGTDWFSVGEIAARLCALIAIVICAISLAASSAPGGIEISITSYVETLLTQIVKVMALDVNAQGLDLMVERMAALFPALTTLSWLFMMLVNATLAQVILVKLGKASRPTPRYREIEVPEWTYWTFVAAAALKLLTSGDIEYVAQNLVVVFGAPFFLVGLAVAHSLAHRIKMPGMALGAMYGSFLIFPWAPVVVTVVGFAEQWARLRDRYGRSRTLAPHSQSEDE